MILVQLLRSFGTPAFGGFRAALLQEFKDKLQSLDRSDWVDAIKNPLKAEYDGHLRLLSSPRLSDRQFLARAFKALNRGRPYLFTTPSMVGIEHFSATGTSDSGFSEYEINLASLPQSYKRRIFIAPDGSDTFHVEVDFPWRTLRDALTFARAIRLVNDRHSDMY